MGRRFVEVHIHVHVVIYLVFDCMETPYSVIFEFYIALLSIFTADELPILEHMAKLKLGEASAKKDVDKSHQQVSLHETRKFTHVVSTDSGSKLS